MGLLKLTAFPLSILGMDRHGRRVALESRAGGVLAVLPGQHVPAGVHRGGAPRSGVSVYPGAAVALSPLVDEGEHTATVSLALLIKQRDLRKVIFSCEEQL